MIKKTVQKDLALCNKEPYRLYELVQEYDYEEPHSIGYSLESPHKVSEYSSVEYTLSGVYSYPATEQLISIAYAPGSYYYAWRALLH